MLLAQGFFEPYDPNILNQFFELFSGIGSASPKKSPPIKIAEKKPKVRAEFRFTSMQEPKVGSS